METQATPAEDPQLGRMDWGCLHRKAARYTTLPPAAWSHSHTQKPSSQDSQTIFIATVQISYT